MPPGTGMLLAPTLVDSGGNFFSIVRPVCATKEKMTATAVQTQFCHPQA